MINTSTSSVQATNKFTLSQAEGLIPKLRFPEFVNEGEWEEKRLEKVCEINPKISQLPERFVYIDLESVEKGTLLQKKIINIEGAPSRAQRLLNNHDVIFQMVRPYQKNNYYFFKEDANHYVASTGYAQLRAFESSMYLYQFLHADRFVTSVLEKCTGSNYPAINSSDLSQILVQLPPIPKEQQKIASCLSSLDELITAHSVKLEALKDHKKGLMQNLFPQDGETVPKYRFKEFEKDGEWVEKFVEDYFLVGSSKRVLQEDWTNQGVPFYRTRELVSLNKNEPFGSEIFISEEMFLEIAEKYGLPSEGDFLVSGVGTLGICYQVQKEDKFYFKDGNVLWFKQKKGLHSTYFKYCFQSEHIQHQIRGQASISTVGTYTIQNAKKTKFWYPFSFTEQQKIASCLSSLDELITAQAEKIEQLKLHKKGLMQGLFPKVND